MVVIHPPRFDLAPRVLDRQELIGVQTFVAQLAIEGLDEAVFYGLPGPDEVEQHTSLVRPLIENAGSEFGAVIDRDRLRLAVLGDRAIERFGHRAS
jgi:hypothetical protein